MVASRKYKPSRKREETSEQMRRRIKDGAWTVFARQGLDGSTITDIVAESGSSTGSFYNHYRTKQAVFDELLADRTAEVRSVTSAARARADDLETMLRLSYEDLLDHILGIEDALSFLARNQHHIRTSLYGGDGTSDLLADIRDDVARGMPGLSLDDDEISLVASLIVSIGIETLLRLDARRDTDISALAALMTRLIVGGIGGLRQG
ncbi:MULTISPECIES: TetR/AcrR family transcriptional regulator [unclassified Aureimonas]|uniref:TetR/AcrR family transcriptional regulator n=1 Tax=unclassified Aureimonas TaxID=2615206 RepID=UPI0006F5AB20|nr:MULTISPECIES: TetR/AcrR family transcriptional regulator [unclassified Aureimonas]KQT53944.1 hypothetical protein ASG62_11990 [Aureimonas sp. Leaf427]KQT71616.1 hypothetical protein ASG54_19170 [Aureimonas sp. Leaf460]